MPVYDFECVNINCVENKKTLELLTSFTKKPICSNCKQYLTRLLSCTSNIHIKNSATYIPKPH